VDVRTPQDLATRIEVIKRRDAFERDAEAFAARWKKDEDATRRRLVRARERLPEVQLGDEALARIASLCMGLGTDGLRGELTLMRAARAYAALQGDSAVADVHIRTVARPALRHRLRRDPLDDTDAGVRVERVLAEVFGTAA
jgi:magnesium chelatase subunit I